MLRNVWVALSVLVSVFIYTPNATAQTLNSELFARDTNISSVSLSLDCLYVVMIQAVAVGEAVVVVDWRSRAAQAIQTAREDRGLFLDWVAWKNDEALLFAVSQRRDWDGTPQNMTYEVIRRVYAMNRDGSGVTQMFEGQMRRLAAADYAPMHLIDVLDDDPNNVLFGTWGQNGYTIYRADMNNLGAAR